MSSYPLKGSEGWVTKSNAGVQTARDSRRHADVMTRARQGYNRRISPERVSPTRIRGGNLMACARRRSKGPRTGTGRSIARNPMLARRQDGLGGPCNARHASSRSRQTRERNRHRTTVQARLVSIYGPPILTCTLCFLFLCFIHSLSRSFSQSNASLGCVCVQAEL